MKRKDTHKHKFLPLLTGLLLLGFMGVKLEIIRFGPGDRENRTYTEVPSGFGRDAIHKNDSVYRDTGDSPVRNEQLKEESKAAFAAAYNVFMHPRCMNCHPAGDVPLQGDDSHLHTQGVKRGVDGKGLFANKCSNCHQTEPLDGPHLPPGAPVWHLPPSYRKMVFEGKSPRELAAGFKDSTFTGFKTMERFIEHVEHDPLVQNSFTYGTKPPLSHEEFVAKVKEWIEKGAVLPDK